MNPKGINNCIKDNNCLICNKRVTANNSQKIAVMRAKHLINIHNFVVDPKFISNSKRYFN